MRVWANKEPSPAVHGLVHPENARRFIVKGNVHAPPRDDFSPSENLNQEPVRSTFPLAAGHLRSCLDGVPTTWSDKTKTISPPPAFPRRISRINHV